MRPRLAMVLFALCMGVGAWPRAGAEPVTYVLDPSHTQVTWEVMHLGTSTMRGRFNRIQGHVVLDRVAKTAELSAQIDTGSVSSGVAPLDSLLRRKDMLASEAHPSAYFVARRFVFDGDRPSAVRGEFTLRGTSLPLELRAVRFNCYTHPMLQREVCGGDFEGEFRRSNYGINHSLPFVADTVRLLIQAEGIRR